MPCLPAANPDRPDAGASAEGLTHRSRTLVRTDLWRRLPGQPARTAGPRAFDEQDGGLSLTDLSTSWASDDSFASPLVPSLHLHLDARLFFTHRGLEKLAEGRSLVSALTLLERACGVCTVTHGLAYSQAVEQLTDTQIPARANWSRVILAEMERLYNHVGDLGNICAGIGFHPGSSRLGALKERLLQLNERVTGHRYLMGCIVPGGLREELAVDGLEDLPAALMEVGHDLAGAVRLIIRSDGVHARLHGTGAVSMTMATALGASGVAARAAGIDTDLRRDEPYAAYRDLDVSPVSAAAGDVLARFNVRAQETQVSLRLIREALAQLPPGPVRVPLCREAVTGQTARTGPPAGRHAATCATSAPSRDSSAISVAVVRGVPGPAIDGSPDVVLA